jgi:NitT/TauT family transport system permease protein
MRRIKDSLIDLGWPIISFVILIAVWESVAKIFHFSLVVLPTPLDVVASIGANFGRLARETGITMLESVLGFLIGSLTAFVLGILFVHSQPVRRSIYPYAIALKSTPLIAIAPLLTLWFGNGILSKVVMSALVAFFPVLVNAATGLASVDPMLIDLMDTLSARWWHVLTKVRVPHSLPYVFASLKVASSMAVVGAVIGEFTGSTSGIGHLLTTSSYYLDTDLVFAGVIFITIAGLLFFGIVAYIEKRSVFW